MLKTPLFWVKRVILLKKRETTLIFFLKCRNQADMWVLWILNRTVNTGMKRRLRHLQPTIYDALDTLLNLPPGATKKQVLKAMENHIVDQVQLMGEYRR